MTNQMIYTARMAADKLVSDRHGVIGYDGISEGDEDSKNLSFEMAMYFVTHVDAWWDEQTPERFSLMYEAFWRELSDPLSLLTQPDTH